MSDLKMSEIIQKKHDQLIAGAKKYYVLKDYSGTYIEKQMIKEEKMIYPIFRVFEAARPEKNRKLNIDPRHAFDQYNDSVMDYASIIASKLNKAWQKYNRLISFQIPLCPNDCWHCFLPKELYIDSGKNDYRYEEISAKSIIENFLDQRESDLRQNKYSNVLRITGGEPFLLPELIRDCLEILKNKNLEKEVFIWTETNLEPFMGDDEAFMDSEDNKQILEELGKYNNFLVHPCFHGLDAEEFNMITGKDYSISLESHIKALKRLLDSGIDIYPTIGSNTTNPKNLNDFFEKLKELHSNLPLRVALIEYRCDYEPIRERLEKRNCNLPIDNLPIDEITCQHTSCPTKKLFKKINLQPKLYSKFANLRIWNELLIKYYGVGNGVIPRHFVSLNEDKEIKVIDDDDNEIPEYNGESIYLFKSSYRVLYHQEVLDILALPYGHIININYDKKYVQDDLFIHMQSVESEYKGKTGYFIYVDKNQRTLLPIREFEIANIKIAGDILSITIDLKNYISFASGDDRSVSDKFTFSMRKYFGNNTLPPGGKYILKGERLFFYENETIKRSQAFEMNSLDITSGSDFEYFSKIIPNLISYKAMSKSLFYKIEMQNIQQIKEDNSVCYKIEGGKSFSIILEYFLPNYNNFNEENHSERTICFESSSSTISPVGSTEIVCSKYGTEKIDFKTKINSREEKVTIKFWNKYDEFKGPKLNIYVKVCPPTSKSAVISTIPFILLSLATSGIAMYTNSVATKGNTQQSINLWGSFWDSIKVLFWVDKHSAISNIGYFVLLLVILFLHFRFVAIERAMKPGS